MGRGTGYTRGEARRALRGCSVPMLANKRLQWTVAAQFAAEPERYRVSAFTKQ